MAAELFYEGVISEVVAFVMQHSSFCPDEHRSIPLTREDREAIDFICGYIASNLGGDLSCSRLANQLYIGKTKLKTSSKRQRDCRHPTTSRTSAWKRPLAYLPKPIWR